MRNCLNLIGGIALLVFAGSCCGFFTVAGSSDAQTQEEFDQASQEASPYLCLSIVSFIVVGLVTTQTRRMARNQKEVDTERRHQEQIDAMYLAASMQAQNNRPSAVGTDDLMIERAKLLYQQGDIDGCKALLRTMPNNPKAKRALAKIENH